MRGGGRDATEVLPVGGTLRFAAGRYDGPRSQTWNIVTNAKTPDVYIGLRESMHEVKLSLHEKTWRLALTAQAAERACLPDQVDRVIQRWTPTDPIDRRIDWRLAVAIVTPRIALGPVRAEKRVKGEPIRFSPAPEEGFDRLFLVMLGAPGAGHFWLDPDAEIGRIAVAGGGQVAVWADRAPASPDAELGLESVRQHHAGKPPHQTSPSGFIHAGTVQGVPVLVDVGLGPSNADRS